MMMMMMIWLPSMNAYALWTRQMDVISVNGCTGRKESKEMMGVGCESSLVV